MGIAPFSRVDIPNTGSASLSLRGTQFDKSDYYFFIVLAIVIVKKLFK